MPVAGQTDAGTRFIAESPMQSLSNIDHKSLHFIDHNCRVQIPKYCGSLIPYFGMINLCMARPVKRARPHPFDAKSFLATPGKGRTLAKYRKNGKIYNQGDDADAIFYIQAGEVKLTVFSDQGREAVVGIMTKDHFFGEGCLTSRAKCVATATSINESTIMRIERETFLHAMKENPTLSQFFVEHLLARTIRVEADLIDQLFNSSEKRLARTLLLLANFGKEGMPEPIIRKISQETLAEIVGTTRSRISFFMNKFRRLGFIKYNGRIEVHSSLLNVVLADHLPVRKAKSKKKAEALA